MIRSRPFGLLVVAALTLAACGGGASATPSPSAPPAAPTDAATEAAPTDAVPTTAPTGASATAGATGAAGSVTIELADTDLGEILVDAEGATLYGFVPDEEGGEPTCYDDCAAAWPPLLVEGEIEAGEGLSADLFTTVERTDGGMQLKAGDWPLYYFANDEAPGDTNGQALNEVWYVVDANGELIREAAGSTTETDSRDYDIEY